MRSRQRLGPKLIGNTAGLERRLCELGRVDGDVLVGALRDPVHRKMPARRIGLRIPNWHYVMLLPSASVAAKRLETAGLVLPFVSVTFEAIATGA